MTPFERWVSSGNAEDGYRWTCLVRSTPAPLVRIWPEWPEWPVESPFGAADGPILPWPDEISLLVCADDEVVP